MKTTANEKKLPNIRINFIDTADRAYRQKLTLLHQHKNTLGKPNWSSLIKYCIDFCVENNGINIPEPNMI